MGKDTMEILKEVGMAILKDKYIKKTAITNVHVSIIGYF